MKKIMLLSFFALLISSNIVAQSFSVTPNPAFATADLDDISTNPGDLLAPSTISNNAGDTLNIMWERVFEDLPEDWVSAIADPFISYPPFVGTGDFWLLPSESAALDVHVFPSGFPGSIDGAIPGVGEVHLKIINLDDPTDTLIAEYHFTLTGSPVLNLSELELEALDIFPNPASGYFMLKEADKIERVVIYDVLGHEVKSFVVSTGRCFNINELPNGSYFVKLIDRSLKMTKTLRLQKF